MGRRSYHPYSVAERLLPDKDFKYSNIIAVQRYLAEQRQSHQINMNASIADSIVEQSKYTLPVKYNKLYRYLNNNDRYSSIGLPKSSYIYNPDIEIKNNIQEYLEQKHSSDIDFIWFHIGQRNLYFYAWFYLIEEYGYDFKTNELTKLSDLVQSICYLYDGQIHHDIEKEYDDEIIFTGLAFDYGATFDRSEDKSKVSKPSIEGDYDLFKFIYTYQENNIAQYDEISIDLNHLNKIVEENDTIPDDADFIQVMYKVNQEIYLFEQSFNDLTTLLNSNEDIGEFYPRLYVRLHQRDVISRNDEDVLRKQTTKAFHRLGLSLKDITSQLQKSLGGDYGDVHHLFINPAIAINVDGSDNIIAEYLYKYFNRLYDKSITISGNLRTGISQQISDKVYTQNLYFKTISKETINEVFDEINVGEYIVKFTAKPRKRLLGRLRSEKGYHVIYFRHDVDRYTMITLEDLTLQNTFSGRGTSASGSDSELVIPLDRLLIQELSPKEKEWLFHKALHVQISLVKVTKKKWYQTGVFKAVIAIVGIVISYFSAGTGATISAKLLAVAQGMAVSTAIGLAIDLAVKLAVKLGLNARIAGIIAFVVSIALAKGKGNWEQAFNAVNIMKALNTAFDVHNKVLAQNMNKLIKETNEFKEYTQFKEKELVKAQRMLNTGVVPLDLELLVSPISNLYLNFGETVEEFYNRTIDIDVTYLTQSIASNYVEYTTSLPTFVDTYKVSKPTNSNDDLSLLLV